MERALSVEEKIRRAEEIYNRRNGNNYYDTYVSNYREKKSPSLKRRFIKQIVICFMIYGVFYVVSNRDYFLSNDFRIKVEDIVAKNVFLNDAYHYVMTYAEKYFREPEEKNENQPDAIEEKREDSKISNEKISLENNTENIGGSEENINIGEEKTQEEKDAMEIQKKIKFIVPVQGKISSTFGWRTPTTSTVPKYHTGLDIAAVTGTVIKSATDGIVQQVSSQGDYGKHYKIQIEDITIIYAHCSKLYMNEGDTVYQGQEIAEVGSTRKFYSDLIYILKSEKKID